MILTNCTDSWPAATTWTFDRFLSAGGGHETWRTDFISDHDILHMWGQKEHIPGHLISDIWRRNGTFRIFEVLGRGRARKDRDNVHKYKTKLMRDYDKPQPVPEGRYTVPADNLAIYL